VRDLCGKAGVNSTTLCRPLPYRLHVAPLERGRWNPRKGYDHLPRTRPGRRRDVRSAEHVSSITFGSVRPSPPLCCHPRRYGSPGRRDTATPAAVQPPVLLQPNPRAVVRTETKREAPTSLPSKPLLDKHMTCHNTRQKRDSPGQPSTPRHCALCRHM
jgi:hypothetical protein